MFLREAFYSHYAFWMLPQCLSDNKVVAVEVSLTLWPIVYTVNLWNPRDNGSVRERKAQNSLIIIEVLGFTLRNKYLSPNFDQLKTHKSFWFLIIDQNSVNCIPSLNPFRLSILKGMDGRDYSDRYKIPQ